MTVARSVTDGLTEHVLFEIDCVDRMYCNVYVPQLQYAAGLVGYVHRQLALPIASTAPLARITGALDKAVHRFARDHRLPWVDFESLGQLSGPPGTGHYCRVAVRRPTSCGDARPAARRGDDRRVVLVSGSRAARPAVPHCGA